MATKIGRLNELDNVANLKVNLTATIAPTVTDDFDSGYSVGSRWIDEVADKEYVCLDSTVGAAVWTETTSAGAGAGDMLASTYDPTSVIGDTFNMDNMVEGTAKILTATERTKLANIEANATADQSNIEIKTAYEANTNTNVFTDAEQTKLTGVESNATADQIASEVPIVDSGVLITATEVEGALAENRTAINLNTSKVTNVSTDLSEGTSTETTVDVNSSDGTNATLVSASATRAGLLTKAKFDEIVVNNSKLTNATHTGEVTGAGALTVDKTVISGKTPVTAVGTDYVLIGDSSDTDNLKKALVSDFGAAADDTAYNATTWDGNTDAATKNAIRDKVETMDAAIVVNTAKNSYPSADSTKLSNIEENADVTDAVNIASSIVGVVDKATPVDADSIGLIDSAAANVLKELTWANVKATLKTYFDGIYNSYVHPNHTGDVTSVADGATTIVADSVTYDKMQDVSATDKILGRSTAGAGTVEEISCTAAGRAILDDANATAQRTTLGAAPIADPTFTGEIGIGAVNVSETELGILEGATLSTIELNYVDGVTSAIQTQLGTKAGSGANSDITGLTGITGDIEFSERADHLGTPSAGKGYLWTKSTAPSTLIFTDDDGTDVTLGSGSLIANINLPAEAAYLPATNPAELTEVAGATTYGGWSYLAFDDTTAETAIWRVKLHGYDGGNIIVKADIKPATTPDGTPDPVTVAFDILTIGIASGETFDTAVLTDAANGSSAIDMSIALSTGNANTEVVEGSVTINPDNVASGDILAIGLKRNPTAEDVTNDHLEGDVQLLGITLEYTRA